MLGKGVDSDRAAAFAWFRKAADLGHAKAINIVGGFYEDGWEVRRDLGIAFDHYRLAAEGGDFRGQFNYARLLADRNEIATSIQWLQQAWQTATDAFREKMLGFLRSSSRESLREFGARLDAQRKMPASNS